MRTQASVDDGNTLRGMELSRSLLNFPVRQRFCYPVITENNGVVNLFKATPLGVELSNNPRLAAMEESSALTSPPGEGGGLGLA